MHHEDIKAAIRKQGITPADLAKTLNVSAMSVSRVIRGDSKSEAIAKAISKVTGLAVDVLWPGLYTERPSGAVRAAALLRGQPRRKAA